jgi:diguanylate cyclase (GGDEF)-like protein
MTRRVTRRAAREPRIGDLDPVAPEEPGPGDVERLRQEIARLREEIRQLECLAHEDALCGILNRRGFDREFQRVLAHVARYGTRAALLLIDLNGFKHINDAKGHAEGDQVLQRVARALSGNVRASDVVARIGGDEFAIILWHASADEARAKAARLTAALPIGASTGAAEIRGPDSAAVYGIADADLYADKRTRGFLTR